MALATPPHLAPKLKKEYSYTFTPPLDICDLLYGELHLYLIQEVTHVCAVFVLGNADVVVSGRDGHSAGRARITRISAVM